VLPSKAEGLPNAVLEYMSAGLATIASHVGGNVEIVSDGETGLLVPPQDSAAIAAAVLRLLRDEELRQALGHRGQESIREHFSFERLISETDRMYTELLQRKGRC
jgi:glycosyltransferase involved in cell wall biosynthesis